MSVRRDYKSSPASKKKRRTRRRGLLIIGLLLMTGFAALLVYAFYWPEPTPITASHQSRGKPQDTRIARTEETVSSSVPPTPKYDFYKVLPGREVTIPEEELKPRTLRNLKELPSPKKEEAASAAKSKDQPTKPASISRPKGRYVIQAGSFRNHAEADQRKASLALLLGITAHIETATGPNNATWHRVRIGPLEDFNRAQTMRQRLQKNNIQAIIVKR